MLRTELNTYACPIYKTLERRRSSLPDDGHFIAEINLSCSSTHLAAHWTIRGCALICDLDVWTTQHLILLIIKSLVLKIFLLRISIWSYGGRLACNMQLCTFNIPKLNNVKSPLNSEPLVSKNILFTKCTF